MKNQKKQLLTLVTLFVFLIFAYIGLQIYNDNETKKEEEENTIVITEFTAEEVVAFSYDYNGSTYSYTLKDEAWIYDGDTTLDMDESLIVSMLTTAGSLLGQEKVSEYDSLDTYGLDAPVKTITFTFTDGTVQIIKIGTYNEILGFYYLMVEGDTNLYLVDGSIYDTFEVSDTELEVVVEESVDENTEESTEESTEEILEETVEESTEEAES